MKKVIFEISKVGDCSSRKITEKVKKVTQTVEVKRKILRMNICKYMGSLTAPGTVIGQKVALL